MLSVTFAQPYSLSKNQKYPSGGEISNCGRVTSSASTMTLTNIAYCNYSHCFKFEEAGGDLSDCYMTQRLKSKVEKLGELVYNEWNGEYRILITEAWDNNKVHSGNSLHYEGRAVDMVVVDAANIRHPEKMGRLGGLAIEAGFDWVWYEKNHIHASVKK